MMPPAISSGHLISTPPETFQLQKLMHYIHNIVKDSKFEEKLPYLQR